MVYVRKYDRYDKLCRAMQLCLQTMFVRGDREGFNLEVNQEAVAYSGGGGGVSCFLPTYFLEGRGEGDHL